MKESIDPESEKAERTTRRVAKHYRAHMVVYGFVMGDEQHDRLLEYQFRPLIYHRNPRDPGGDSTGGGNAA